MKKRIGALAIVLIIGIISMVAFVGCGISGEKVTQEEYDKAMSSFTGSVLAGNIQADVTTHAYYENQGKKVTSKSTSIMAIQDNEMTYSRSNIGILKIEEYLVKIDDQIYRIYKLSTGWRASATDKDLSSVLTIAATVQILDLINVPDFSGLTHKDGRYYFSDESLEKANKELPLRTISRYNECCIAIKNEKIIGMGIKFTLGGGTDIDYDEEIKFSYSPNIVLPKYDI